MSTDVNSASESLSTNGKKRVIVRTAAGKTGQNGQYSTKERYESEKHEESQEQPKGGAARKGRAMSIRPEPRIASSPPAAVLFLVFTSVPRGTTTARQRKAGQDWAGHANLRIVHELLETDVDKADFRNTAAFQALRQYLAEHTGIHHVILPKTHRISPVNFAEIRGRIKQLGVNVIVASVPRSRPRGGVAPTPMTIDELMIEAEMAGRAHDGTSRKRKAINTGVSGGAEA